MVKFAISPVPKPLVVQIYGRL